MELYSAETCHRVPHFFACKKKRQLELQQAVGIQFHGGTYLRN
jgi:hypothetical protein